MTDTATTPAGIVDLNAIVERVRAAGMFACVEYTGGGCATIYASIDEDPTRPGMPSLNHVFHCDEHVGHDPGAQALAGPGFFIGNNFQTRRIEGENDLPDGAYAYLSELYIGFDDQGDNAPGYTATAHDTVETLAARLITTVVDAAAREGRYPDDPCTLCGHVSAAHAQDDSAARQCFALVGGSYCPCRGYKQ